MPKKIAKKPVAKKLKVRALSKPRVSKARPAHVNWPAEIGQLIDQFRGRKHPLDYLSRYQLLVAVVLSAQDSDRHINKIAPSFFSQYPDMTALAAARPEDLYPLLSSVRNFRNKSKWLTTMAGLIQNDDRIPTTMASLTELPGIGRKSASVIIRESGGQAEGVIVDLHVVRVAPRLGLVTETRPDKIEKQLMEALPREQWGEAGMAISFLGRDICRPSQPKCGECSLNSVCAFFVGGRTVKKARTKSGRK